MPEEQPYRGNRWTKHAVELLGSLGWNLKGDTNMDVPCTIHTGRKVGHGIDAFLTYFDPYQNCEIGVITETKYYAWNNINKEFVQESVDNLIQAVECVPHSEEFTQKLNFNHAKVNTGLLMIWSHDKFDKSKFEAYLQEVKIPEKHNTSRIYILNNYEILKLYSIVNVINGLTNELNGKGKFDIYYPSYPESDSLRGKKFVGLEYFNSKFIFGKMVRIKEFSNGAAQPINVTVVLYFDKLTAACLKYMYLALRRFQLTDEEIWVYHYEDPGDYRGQIREFERQYGEIQKKQIIFKPMNRFEDVPWRHA